MYPGKGGRQSFGAVSCTRFPARIAPGQWRIDYAPYQVLSVRIAG
ncbi:MAG: hypothetical protein ACOYOU_12630 [Kiritimatiellia bacterium]